MRPTSARAGRLKLMRKSLGRSRTPDASARLEVQHIDFPTEMATEDRSSPAYPWIGRNLVGGACFAGASF
jgi:hypothetical protein